MVDELSAKEKQEFVFGIHDSEEQDVFAAWNENTAKSIAASLGVELTEKHWDVINFLRIHYQNIGEDTPPAHELSKTLEERFSDEGGLKYLYELFPGGPLSQGCRIAGVPVPHDAKQASFGSVS